MLKVSNLTKIYKNKKGLTIKALDNISLSFEETGMIFLIGKSGSGKSTLLNVCGGLDDATSGEIVVKGKSSKKFSKSDFDSYRNTYIGFIFQEYNILNEFTVEQNISLALELQGKPKDKESINKLLNDVDLEGYAKRKPNTLSGGQKQRIAIARALIKNPEIIMADEPTGALDSTTGTQVLDTLKKLSKERLVIVVSHDKEFAEKYADRIIELKDGKIIKDVEKISEQNIKLTNNLSQIGEDIIFVNKNNALNEEDYKKIISFIANSNESILLAKNDNDIKKFKIATHITDDNQKELFKETKIKEEQKYDKDSCKLIKSKLPLKHAFRIGSSSLKHKPIRLFMTISLCTFAFIMFGLLSTLTFYNKDETFKKTLQNTNQNQISLIKQYKVKETYYYDDEPYSYTNSYQTSFNKEELTNYINEYGKQVYYGLEVDYHLNTKSTSNYYLNNINFVAYLDVDNPLRNNIIGSYPQNNNEILLTTYLAESLLNNGLFDSNTNKDINLTKKEDIINKKIAINNKTYKVTGLLKTKEIDTKYESIKKENTNYDLQSKFINMITDSNYLYAYITEKELEEISETIYYENPSDDFTSKNASLSIKINNKYNFEEYSNTSYTGIDKKPKKDNIYYLSENKDGIIVAYELFASLMQNYYNNEISNGNNDLYDDYELANILINKGKYEYDNKTGESNYIKYSKKELENTLVKLLNKIKKSNIKLETAIKLFDTNTYTYISNTKEVKLSGVWFPNNYNHTSKILLPEKLYNELWTQQKENMNNYTIATTKYTPENTQYQKIILPYENKNINKYLKIKNTKYSQNDSKPVLSGNIIDNLNTINELISSLNKIFLYGGIILAIFSCILFSNFITVSISYKKKEIGILRAIGARSLDVFKIFFSESLIITIICISLSLLGSTIITNLINNEIYNKIDISILIFGIISILVLIILGIISSIIATILPVYSAARKKPVESIRSI